MNGRAPNSPATGSHVVVTRNRAPKARIAPDDSQASAATRPTASATTNHTALFTTSANRRAPRATRGELIARGGEDSRPAVPTPGVDAMFIYRYWVAAMSGLPPTVIFFKATSICLTTGAGSGA